MATKKAATKKAPPKKLTKQEKRELAHRGVPVKQQHDAVTAGCCGILKVVDVEHRMIEVVGPDGVQRHGISVKKAATITLEDCTGVTDPKAHVDAVEVELKDLTNGDYVEFDAVPVMSLKAYRPGKDHMTID